MSMPHCVLKTVLSNSNYRTIAAMIETVFWQTNNSENDYIRIMRCKKDDIEFTKGNYNQIYNQVTSAGERIDLIEKFLIDKANYPLQGGFVLMKNPLVFIICMVIVNIIGIYVFNLEEGLVILNLCAIVVYFFIYFIYLGIAEG